MRTAVLTAAVATALVLLGVPAAAAAGHPGGAVTDDPSDQHPGVLFNGSGLSSVEPFLGGQEPASRAQRSARGVTLVGALKLDPFNLGVHGDVAGWKDLAFVGKWREACPGTGVDIIDIKRPKTPVKIADTRDYADTSMEDMQVMNIRGRDILGIGLQDCGNSATEGTVGLELYDITNPRNPQFLSLFNGEDFGLEAEHGHVHEFDLTRTPDGRTLALLASPDLEALTSNPPDFNDGVGDLLIVDVTDPSNPTLLSHWGVLQEPALGLEVYLSVLAGGDARTLDHSVRANKEGTLAYVSYWDAGFIMLDISDPSDPVFLGRTEYAPGEEGNAHSVDESPDGQFLAAADEDFSPFELRFSSSAFAGFREAFEGEFTVPIATLPGRAMEGEVVHVGRGCPADAALGLQVADPYLADPAGKIALIERGLCRFDNKIARAQMAGAIGAIVYNNAANGETPVLMGGNSPVVLGSPDVIGTVITIPGISVVRSTGLLLVGGTPPVTARAEAFFNGWGALRFYDISDPANPVLLSTFATPNTNNVDVALEGTWSVHNPEWHGTKVFASWYNDGIRVLDVRDPTSPEEVAFWVGAGVPADAPPVNIWSVVPHEGLLLASDRNYGLYILKLGR
jgi:PA domain/LVIVD repeat